MEKYYYLEMAISSDIEAQVDDLAMSNFNCTGIEEFSIDEPSVDAILGQRSYSGADLPLSVIEEVEHTVTSELTHKKLYFECEQACKTFQAHLKEKYQIQSKVCSGEVKDWNEEWKKSYSPILVNESLEIIPEWNKHTYHSSALEQVYIYPGMGFGTGGHETTFLCLKLFSELEYHETSSCLDFGCGSGILGLAYKKLLPNADIIDLYDIDQQALDNCIQNIELNDISVDDFKLLLPKNRNEIDKKYDLVFANILQNVLLLEKKFLSHAMCENGYLILSGLLKGQEEEVINSYCLENSDLKHVKTIQKGDWVAVLMKRG